MEKTKFNGGGIFAVLLGVVFIGAALSGVMFNDYWLDEAEECKGGEVLIGSSSAECGVYPYQDGNGVSPTPVNERWTNEETDYKTPYDVFADAIRDLCDANNECFSTASTYLSEIEFFCIIEGFSTSGFMTFPGNIAQVIISYEAESGFDMSNSLLKIQEVCYPSGPGTYVQGDLPTLQEPE